MIVEQRPSLIIIIGQKTQSVDIKTHASVQLLDPRGA